MDAQLAPRVTAIGLLVALLIIIPAAFLIEALSPGPHAVVSPELVGHIDNVRQGGAGVVTVTVATRELRLDRSMGGQRQLGGNRALDGLLLYGSEPSPWFLVALHEAAGCYDPALDMAFDESDAIVFVDAGWDVGIRLSKAADFSFDQGQYRITGTGRYVGGGVEGTLPPPFCVAESGEVLGIR